MIFLKIFFLLSAAFAHLQSPAEAEEAAVLTPLQIKDESPSDGPYGAFNLSDIPVSTSEYSEGKRQEYRIDRLSDVTKLEASASDSYNASGYWDSLSIRGFTLDNKFSYFREGLPISAETSLPLDNKADVQILKGLSALQNGTASPGGAVNYRVKRPASQDFEKIQVGLGQNREFLIGAERSRKLSEDSPFAYHLHATYENLDPKIQNSQGTRHFLSSAWDYRLSDKTLVQFEGEWSKKSQASQAGLSLFGDSLPQIENPSLNLNNQPWTLPVVMEGLTGSVSIKNILNEKQDWSLILGTQILNSDDRLAYAYGCSAEDRFDRFCADGSFDVYDFRSEGEKRTSTASRLTWNQKYEVSTVQNQLSLGLLAHRMDENFQKQAYNYVGTSRVQSPVALPADPARTDEATLRNSEQIEFSLLNVSKFRLWELWLGLRQSEILRHTVRTDGSRRTQFRETFLLGTAAIVRHFDHFSGYFSFGEGLEAQVVPNRDEYQRAGEFLRGNRSQQFELGLKNRAAINTQWKLALFQLEKPLVLDAEPFYLLDGKARHQGFEAQVRKTWNRWSLGLGALLLEAKVLESNLAPQKNGLRPVNVPFETLKGFIDFKVDSNAHVFLVHTYEGNRKVTTDNGVELPGWQRFDLGARFKFLQQHSVQLNIENVLDTQYWRESPTQYGHIYLYPGMERTISASWSQRF